MFSPSVRLAPFVLVAGLLAARAASADDAPAVRAQRPLRLALLLPDWTANRPDSCCIPAPGVAVSWNLGPQLALIGSTAAMRLQHGSFGATVALGADAFLTRSTWAPYLQARLLYQHHDPDEGDTERFTGALVGLGIERAGPLGFSGFFEVGGAALHRRKGDPAESDWVSALRVVLGIGYRFGA
jgi:hypothetical protein